MNAFSSEPAPVGVAPWLDVTPLEVPEPLDAQMGVIERRSTIETLELHLFGDPLAEADARLYGGAADLPPLKTYALLDAGCDSSLPTQLETSGLTHKCLFIGKSLEELGDTAPWLVELTPDHNLTRRLMTKEDAPGGLWDKQLSLFLRSRSSLDVVWKHLRRFTRLRDETGKWYYFRFWSAPISTRLLAMGNHPDVAPLVSAMFPSGTDAISVLATSKSEATFMSRAPETVAPSRGQPLIMTAAIREILKQIQREKNFEDIAEIAHRHSAPQTGFTPDESLSRLTPVRDKFYDMGFWRRDHLAKLCCWELILGPGFISSYADGAIKAVVVGAASANAAIRDIERFLDSEAAQGPAPTGEAPADKDIWTQD